MSPISLLPQILCWCNCVYFALQVKASMVYKKLRALRKTRLDHKSYFTTMQDESSACLPSVSWEVMIIKYMSTLSGKKK